MCQPKDKGGRRCPTHQPASIGLKKFMTEQYGLLPEQVEHTFKSLRAQAANRPDPSPEEYAYFISRQKTKLDNSSLDDKAKRSVNRQLDKELGESELPDGATFYALKKLQARTREQKAEFVQVIRQIADHRGTNRNEALTAFREAYQANESSYDSSFESSFDGKTQAIAASMLGNEGTTASGVPEFSTEPRITREPVTGSSWITSMGYDPDDGRLEVETNGRVYAYRGVPEELWNRIQENRGLLQREVFRRGTYAYESAEAAAADAVGRYCEDCHKYKAISGHTCDFSAAEAREAELPDDIREAIAATSEEEATPRRRRGRRVAAEEEAPAEPEKPQYSYEESLRRLREQLETPEEEAAAEEEAEEEATPRRRRARSGPTARQRRWQRELSDREIIDLNESEYGNADGRRSRYDAGMYLAPKAAEIRRAVIQNGNVAEFDMKSSRRYSSWRDDNGDYQSAYGEVTQKMKAYIDNQDGIIKFERVGNPKCDCDVYARNGHCSHMTSNYRFSDSHYARNMSEEELRQGRAEYMESEIKKSITALHKNVDRTSYLRSNTEEGQPIVVTRSSSRGGRDAQSNGIFCMDNMTATEWRNARRLLDQGETVQVNLSSMYVGTSNYWEAEHYGNASATLKKVDDEYVVQEATMSCTRCGRNQETCPHAENVGEFIRTGIQGNLEEYSRYGRNRAASRPTVDYENMDPATRLQELDNTVSSTWTANESDLAEMSRFAAPTGVDRSYSANLDKYIEDVRAAEKKMKDGESPLPFVTENATNGICSRENGRGFGVELEFDIPSGADRYTALAAIGRDLHAEGLTPTPQQVGYHSNARNGYQQWSFETDCTVSGEIVSPVLYDDEESWNQIAKVCEIVKRHGGKATVNAGGHVHMGLGRGEPAEVERRKIAATQIYAAYEDTIRRVQSNPDRKKHRDSQWAAPMGSQTAQNNVYRLRSGNRFHSDHHSSLNLGHQGRIEFRGGDGSLDPAHIQAQVMVAAGVVAAAERGELEGDTLKVSQIGSNAKKMKLITKGKSAKAKTDDELVVSDVDLRRFTDDILGSEHGRKMMAGIAANTPWQETRY